MKTILLALITATALSIGTAAAGELNTKLQTFLSQPQIEGTAVSKDDVNTLIATTTTALPGWESLPENAKIATASVIYNRGIPDSKRPDMMNLKKQVAKGNINGIKKAIIAMNSYSRYNKEVAKQLLHRRTLEANLIKS